MDAVLAAGGKWRLTVGIHALLAHCGGPCSPGSLWGSVVSWLVEHIALHCPAGASPRLFLLFGRKCKLNQVFTVVRADPEQGKPCQSCCPSLE